MARTSARRSAARSATTKGASGDWPGAAAPPPTELEGGPGVVNPLAGRHARERGSSDLPSRHQHGADPIGGGGKWRRQRRSAPPAQEHRRPRPHSLTRTPAKSTGGPASISNQGCEGGSLHLRQHHHPHASAIGAAPERQPAPSTVTSLCDIREGRQSYITEGAFPHSISGIC